MTDLDLDPLPRGTKSTITFIGLFDAAGAAATFGAGDVIRWTAKRTYADPDGRAYIRKVSGGGGITFTAGQSSCVVTVLPADFDGMPFADIVAVWDLQLAVAGVAADVVQLRRGKVPIPANVTRTAP